jgi:hypothetical protein
MFRAGFRIAHLNGFCMTPPACSLIVSTQQRNEPSFLLANIDG